VQEHKTRQSAGPKLSVKNKDHFLNKDSQNRINSSLPVKPDSSFEKEGSTT